METLIEIYWSDLSKEKQQELLNAGFVDENVMDGTFPLTEICIYDEEEE
jgi:hypothetical protein